MSLNSAQMADALGWEWPAERSYLARGIDHGWIVPSVHRAEGSGGRHRYSTLDLLAAVAAHEAWPVADTYATGEGRRIEGLRKVASDAVRREPDRRFLIMVPADGLAATTNDLASHLEASGEKAKVTTIVDLDKVRQRLGMAA